MFALLCCMALWLGVGVLLGIRVKSRTHALLTTIFLPMAIGFMPIWLLGTFVYGRSGGIALAGSIFVIVAGIPGLACGVAIGRRLSRYIKLPVTPEPPPEEDPQKPYHGPRCVACSVPVDSGVELCPYCGWTQPNSQRRS